MTTEGELRLTIAELRRQVQDLQDHHEICAQAWGETRVEKDRQIKYFKDLVERAGEPAAKVDTTLTCKNIYCINAATKLHPCPHLSDVGNDNKTLCNCCEDCQHDCADDI